MAQQMGLKEAQLGAYRVVNLQHHFIVLRTKLKTNNNIKARSLHANQRISQCSGVMGTTELHSLQGNKQDSCLLSHAACVQDLSPSPSEGESPMYHHPSLHHTWRQDLGASWAMRWQLNRRNILSPMAVIFSCTHSVNCNGFCVLLVLWVSEWF